MENINEESNTVVDQNETKPLGEENPLGLTLMYSLSLESKIELNKIATAIVEDKTFDKKQLTLVSDKLEEIATLDNASLVDYTIALYKTITNLYEIYPTIDDLYAEGMQIVLDEYNVAIKTIPEDDLDKFISETSDKQTDEYEAKYLSIASGLKHQLGKSDFAMPKYYTVNVDYFDEHGTVYSQVIAFNRVLDKSRDIECIGILKYLIDNNIVDSLTKHPILTIEINKGEISKLAEIYQEFMMQIDKPIISALQGLNLGFAESFAVYKVKYSINLIFDETAIAQTVESAYSQLYCMLFELHVDKKETYSKSIQYENIDEVLPDVAWATFGQHGRLVPYRKEVLNFNRAVLIVNSTYPNIISIDKMPPASEVLKSLNIKSVFDKKM